ncbi:uncharacterized protein LOC142161370 [Mixophyes fleayi]|uniref:uncharacterized protein LOC142161370 n=1 Tax=Mixophyes fleayi TaxID=3061075 RepID=UPI003F4D9479
MFGVQNVYFVLLILHGVYSNNDFFEVQCNKITKVQCGGDITVTCNVTHPNFSVTLKLDGISIMNISELKENFSEDNISIEVSENMMQMKLTIHDVRFSNIPQYDLWMYRGNGEKKVDISGELYGVCDPEISFDNEKLTCEVESQKELPVIWVDSNRKVFPGKDETRPLKTGFKLFSSLKRTDDISKLQMCCYVADVKEKIKCFPKIEGFHDVAEKKVTHYIIYPLIAVLAIACLLLALRHRNRILTGCTEQRHSSLFTWGTSVDKSFKRLKERFVVPQVFTVEDLQYNQGESQEICIELIPAMPTEQV